MEVTDSVTERLPKSEADADLLKPAIVKLLQIIPESWAEFSLDALTAIESNALFLLTAAAMVERRGWFRSVIANHPICFEMRVQATGEGGFAKALEHAKAVEYTTWSDAWRAWKAGEMPDVSPFHIEEMKPQEWRLTDQGVLARADLKGTNRGTDAAAVFDFVFKRGLSGPGYWSRLSFHNPQKAIRDKAILDEQIRLTGQGPARLPRPPLSGFGAIVELRKIDKPAEPQPVSLTNWSQGADAFVVALKKNMGAMFEKLRSEATQSAPTNSPAAAAPADDKSMPNSMKRKRSGKTDTKLRTFAAIAHKMAYPNDSEKDCARSAGMPRTTLSQQSDWQEWSAKIESAAHRPSKLETLKAELDRRTGELIAVDVAKRTKNRRLLT